MNKPLLLFTTGVAGSGKTYFSTRLAAKLPAIIINSDSVRAAQYDDPHNDAQNTVAHHRTVFRSMDYFAKQAIAYGAHVVYDACTNQESVRKVMRNLAESCGAVPVMIVLKTPVTTAKVRATTRQHSITSWQMPPDHHDKHITYYEEVGDTKNVVYVDGTLPFEVQYATFTEQLKALLS